MNTHGGSTGQRSIPAPGLLIITGASHTGKSTIADEVLRAVSSPSASLSVDETLRALRRPEGEIWVDIPLAYRLIAAELNVLLDEGWFVVVESTFTYVSPEGEGSFHDIAIQALLSEARRHGAPTLLAQLTAPRDTILERARQTGRLDPSVVRETVALHAAAELPAQTLALDTTTTGVEGTARAILDRLEESIPA
jgi:chloramphenicol 3-O-phosphotransferase